jgi:SAM-dependent methyltransferase
MVLHLSAKKPLNMSPKNSKLDKIKELYDSNLETHGLSSKSVGWPDKKSQLLRFEKLLSVVDNPSRPFTINELGCGYGELFRYLIKNDFKVRKFYGYDISEKMIAAAGKYISDKRVSLICSSEITTKADYTITSGIFNVAFGEDKKKWEKYIKRTLVEMFENSGKGISFNLLTSYVDFKAKNLYYADPFVFFDFCKKRLSRKVNLLHDYPLFEWTITVRK